MRERLVVTMVAMTVGVIVIFGVLLAYSTADLVRDQEHSAVASSADLAAVAVSAKGADAVSPEFLRQLTGGRQTITWVAGDGTTVSTRTAPRDDDDISATRRVAGTGGGRIILTQEAAVSSERVSDALSWLVLVGLGLAALAAVVGWILAKRFAHPFHRLAADATRIGHGHFDTEVHRSSMREAAELGDALRSAAGQLDRLVRRERELAVVASHELRTPITSLRLSLEDLTMWPETPPSVADELQRSMGEVDRLSGVVTALLEGGGDRRRGASTLDLSVVAADAVDRWADRAAALGRRIELAPSDPSPVRAPRAEVELILDVLVDNALVHGSGTVMISIFKDNSHFRLRVADEGARGVEPGVLHGTATGSGGGSLSDAAAQAASMGGFIGVLDQDTTLISLVLPRADRQRRASDAVR